MCEISISMNFGRNPVFKMKKMLNNFGVWIEKLDSTDSLFHYYKRNFEEDNKNLLLLFKISKFVLFSIVNLPKDPLNSIPFFLYILLIICTLCEIST